MEINPDQAEEDNRVELTADIVSAYVSNNPLPMAELSSLIGNIHAALTALVGTRADAPEVPATNPAVPIKKSVHNDHIVCLEDGKKFKSLKRHLITAHGMTPEDYFAKWSLPNNYPTVAPGYAALRSAIAMKGGLGKKKTEPEANKRGRRKSA